MDFGTFCSADSAGTYLGVTVTETVGVAVPANVLSGTNGTNPATDIIADCNSGANTVLNNGTMNVLREAKDINDGGATGVDVGQIGLNSTSDAIWPFVQLYPLNPTGNVVVQYNKGGGVQSTTLTFDTVDQYARAELERVFVSWVYV